MRIALLTTQWPGARLGGIGTYTVNAARALARGGGAGHDVHVFTFTLPPDAIMPPGATVHQVKTLAEQVMSGEIRGDIAAGVQAESHLLTSAELLARSVRAAEKRIHFDVIEASEYDAIILALTLMGHSGATLITHLHSGSAIAREAGNAAPGPEQSAREQIEWAAIMAADALCGPSRQVFLDTGNAYGKSLKGPVVPLPFDVPDTPFVNPPADGPILYVGRLEHLKGAHLLAAAANDFLRKFPAARLRVAGPDTLTAPGGGSMAAWMQQRIAADLRERVAFTGELTHAQIAEELRTCSFVVIPSLRESYSYVCCESLAAGRAVIVPSRTGAAEVAGDAGIIFENGNVADLVRAVAELCGNSPLRQSLAHNAWRRARHVLASPQTIPLRLEFYRDAMRNFPHQGPLLQDANCLQPLASLQKIRDILDGRIPPMPPGTLTPGLRLLHALDRHGPNTHAYLYGAGRHTTRLLAEKYLWESHGHRILGLIDDHPRFQQNPTFLNLPVQSAAQAAATLPKTAVVILSTDAFEDQFWTQTAPLRAQGITVYRLYKVPVA